MDERAAPVPFLWMEEPGGDLFTPERTKRKYVTKKKEYVGWASRPLIAFLESLGKETREALSQDDVTKLVNHYVNDHNLIHPAKKKKIVCDERLHSLFGKKTVSRIKIHELLESHFAENQDESEDELLNSSQEKEEDTCANVEVQTMSSSNKKSYYKKKEVAVPKSCVAAINSENIKLIYLRRSLVLNLLKFPETFDSKLVGSLVRVKSDPFDYLQKNSHQLQFVTGVTRRTKSGDKVSEVLLEISNSTNAISIPLLSEDNFSEDECKDLDQRMKDGLLKQPTVEELEQKAQVLHEDVTEHSISRELVLLQNLIDRANEKGWRRELSDYLERRKLLQTPDEVSRLLLAPPKVAAEGIKQEAKMESASVAKRASMAADLSPREIQQEASYHSPVDGAMTTQTVYDLGTQGSMTMKIQANGNGRTGAETNGYRPLDLNVSDSQPMQNGDLPCSSPKERVSGRVTARDGLPSSHLHDRDLNKPASQRKQEVQVIELSDDDEDDVKPSCSLPAVLPEDAIWHYVDPQGNVQGPFSVVSLKRWRDADYFAPDFRVWRRGESQAEAVLLVDVLLQVFRH